MNPLSKKRKTIFIVKAIQNSMTGKTAAVSIVIMKDDPISLYHSKFKSGYWPLNGKNDKKVN